MSTYTLPERTLPLDDSWDVIVVGGGPAGCTAATAAAHEGARTLLVEATGCLGGMGTAGLVPAWCPFSDGRQVIHRGLALQVFERASVAIAHYKPGRYDWVEIDPEALKRVYDNLVTEAGVEVLFNSMLADVVMQDGMVDGMVVANKAGLTVYRARVYVDCTGDGDVAVRAGAAFEKGDAQGNLQPATHCFVLSNVDSQAYWSGPNFYHADPHSPIHAIMASGKYPLIVDKHTCNSQIGPGTFGFNTGHLFDVDNTNPQNLSHTLMHGRRMAAQYRDALAEYALPFANAFLVLTAGLMGIRETRRILGDYLLLLDDYLARRSFPDEIGRACYFIDIHGTEEEQLALTKLAPEEAQRQIDEASLLYQPGESYGIPYRCLTPRGLRNVLVAGRCISTDRAVNGSVRVMPVCLVTGQAAGLAAALSAGMSPPDVHAVDTHNLRTRLRAEGAYLPEHETSGFV